MALDTLDPLSAPMPAPPVRQFSFTDFQTNNPTAPPPGDRLDAEFDRANNAISDTINWASVSLNTDGSIRDSVIGESNLQPGLFDDVANDAIAQVQPLVDQAQGFANAASVSASDASDSASTASDQAVIATGAATAANTAQVNASASATSAQGYANTASGAATRAANADNDAQGAVALAQDYAVVTQAWAEHMPDPIPPNILAVMGITGDHWSSRWWANQAANAFGAMTSLYLGVYTSPPTQTPTGQPIPVGAIYYNSAAQAAYVWDGTGWRSFYAPTKALTLSLIYQASSGQTTVDLKTNDLKGEHFTLSSPTPEPVEVYLNGVRCPPDNPVGAGDWTVNTASVITFKGPLRAGTLVYVDVLAPAASIAPSRTTNVALQDFNLDPVTGAAGQVDGTRTTFALVLASDRTPVAATSAVEVLVSVDGTVQQSGTDYNLSPDGKSVVFGEAPQPGARTWAVWYSPGSASTSGVAVTGSRGDGTALLNLLNALQSMGLILNQTVA